MKNSSENKVLYAINHATAERHLSKAIKESGEKIEVVGTVVSNESLIDFLSSKNVDTLVYSDRLPGKENAFDFLMKLKRIYRQLRIVLIANEMNKGDIRLATLVAYGIWDIKYGDGIALSDVAKMIIRPSTYEQASVHLPDDVEWIKFDYGRSKNKNDNSEDHIKLLTNQLGEVNRAKTAIEEKLEEAETRCKELEYDKTVLQSEHSREMLNKENQFIEEKSILTERISVLIEEKNVIQNKYDKEVDNSNNLRKSHEVLVSELNAEKDTLKHNIADLEKKLSKKNEEYDALLSQKNEETFSAEKFKQETIKNAELQRDLMLKEAEQKSNAIIAESEAKKNEIISSATEKSNKILTDAESQRKQLIDEATENSNKMIESAQQKSDEMIKLAEEKINADNAEKIEKINETIAKSSQIINEAEEKLSRSIQEADDIIRNANDESKRLIEDANNKNITAKKDAELAAQKLIDASAEASDILTKANNEADLLKKQAVEEAKQKVDEELRTYSEAEKKKLNDELSRIKEDAERECNLKYEKCLADIAFEQDRKKVKIDELNTEINNLETHKSKLEESIDATRSRITEEKLKIDAELASCESMLSDIRSRKEKELEDLEKEYAARAATTRDMHAEEDKKIVEAAKIEMENKLKSIDSAFTYEKKRLAREFEKYKDGIDEQKAIYAEENRVGEYKFDINKFDLTSGSYQRCVPIMCMSTMTGAGTSSIALNTAMMLAIRGAKTLYIEFDSRNPTFITNMLANNLKENIDSCMSQMVDDNYDCIDANIITKQKMINADLSAKRKDLHERLPDMLHYMAFNTDKPIKNHITADIIKAIVTYVAGKKGYKFIVCDIPSWLSKDELSDLYRFVNDHIIVMNQDHVTIKRLDKMLKATDDHRRGNKSLTDVYVMNKTLENSNLTVGRAKDILKLEEIINIPMNLSEFLLGASNGLPPVLFSKNTEYCAKMKIITDRFK